MAWQEIDSSILRWWVYFACLHWSSSLCRDSHHEGSQDSQGYNEQNLNYILSCFVGSPTRTHALCFALSEDSDFDTSKRHFTNADSSHHEFYLEDISSKSRALLGIVAHKWKCRRFNWVEEVTGGLPFNCGIKSVIIMPVFSYLY